MEENSQNKIYLMMGSGKDPIHSSKPKTNDEEYLKTHLYLTL